MKRILIFVLFLFSFFATSAWSDDERKCSEVLPKHLEFTHNCQAIKGKVDFYRAFPAVAPNGLVNAVVTMPAGTNVKWLVDVQTGVLRVEPAPVIIMLGLTVSGPTNDREKGKVKAVKPNVINYLGQIGNYGLVPHTVDVDGNPLDILVIGGPLLRGSVTPVKLIGAMKFQDAYAGVETHKLIAVLPGTPLAELVNTLADLDMNAIGAKSIIQTWLENYKGPSALVLDSNGLLEAGDSFDGGLDGTAYGVLNDSIIE
ncbi:MAG: inorganic diphosphatase [Candidatus Methylumidiphilus sp.]